MSRIIVVSDLHVDTWDDTRYGEGDRCKTKLEHWDEFLQWCADADVEELVVNGDLLDAPPYTERQSFESPIAREAVSLLLRYASSHPVTYLFGNHDIGISGIRCGRGSAPLLPGLQLAYPDYVLPREDCTLLFHHGHLHDVWLFKQMYEKDLKLRTYEDIERFQCIQQRIDPDTGKRMTPGIALPEGSAIAPHPPGDDTPASGGHVTAVALVEKLKRGFELRYGLEAKHNRWRDGAREMCEDFLHKHSDSRRPLYCFMGHTHIPDLAEIGDEGDLGVYVNSGSWCGEGYTEADRRAAFYVDINPSDPTHPSEWIRDWIWYRSKR